MIMPAYRRVSLRIFATADAARSAEVAAAIHAALDRYGAVRVTEAGPYWKIPADLEFTVDIEPPGPVADCFAAVCALTAGWSDDVWNKRDGLVFLHPAVSWAAIHQAEAAHLPALREGDTVVVRDGVAGRRDGLVGAQAVIEGVGVPENLDAPWSYAVRPAGWETLIIFDEPDLKPVP
ncbi:MAG: hypothetical protein HOV79_15865 [Hamadaea sp.]|nr:hypothetical protein [Hamadaea sp.]